MDYHKEGGYGYPSAKIRDKRNRICKEIKKRDSEQKHMKERIKMLSGVVTFDGSDGFTVNARIPIRWGRPMGLKY